MRCTTSLSRLINSKDFIFSSNCTSSCSHYLAPEHKTLSDPGNGTLGDGNAGKAVMLSGILHLGSNSAPTLLFKIPSFYLFASEKKLISLLVICRRRMMERFCLVSSKLSTNSPLIPRCFLISRLNPLIFTHWPPTSTLTEEHERQDQQSARIATSKVCFPLT